MKTRTEKNPGSQR